MSLLLCRFLDIPLTPGPDGHHTNLSFAHHLLSIASKFRLQMHMTGLYVGVFAALGIAGLLWVMAEKWQQGSEWEDRDVIWMVSFEALLALSAILYKMGANSLLTRKFAVAGAMADVLGIGVALSVPAILWFHWNKPAPRRRKQKDEDSLSSFHYSPTILGLQDYSPPPPPPSPPVLQVSEPKESILTEKPAAEQPPISLERTLHKEIEPAEEPLKSEAIVMDNTNNSNTNSQAQPATSQPVVTTPPPAYQPTERTGAPGTTFRDQLFKLNNSWQRIEATGKEVEDWFQSQQKRVMAHLERPISKEHNDLDFSRDFLEQRMGRVDAEWAAIRQTVRELYGWLENGSVEKEMPQETKVW